MMSNELNAKIDALSHQHTHTHTQSVGITGYAQPIFPLPTRGMVSAYTSVMDVAAEAVVSELGGFFTLRDKH